MGRHSTGGIGTFTDYAEVIPAHWYKGHSHPAFEKLERLVGKGTVTFVDPSLSADRLLPVAKALRAVASHLPRAFDKPIALRSSDTGPEFDPAFYEGSAGSGRLFVSAAPRLSQTDEQLQEIVVDRCMDHVLEQISPKALSWLWSKAVGSNVGNLRLTQPVAEIPELGKLQGEGENMNVLFLSASLLTEAVTHGSIASKAARRFSAAVQLLLGPRNTFEQGLAAYLDGNAMPEVRATPVRVNERAQAYEPWPSMQFGNAPAAGQELYVETDAAHFVVTPFEVINVEESVRRGRIVATKLTTFEDWKIRTDAPLWTSPRDEAENSGPTVTRIIVGERGFKTEMSNNLETVPMVEEMLGKLSSVRHPYDSVTLGGGTQKAIVPTTPLTTSEVKALEQIRINNQAVRAARSVESLA